MTVFSAMILAGFFLSLSRFANKQWKIAQKDAFRNKMFILRDDLRQYFYDNDLDMNSPIYMHTRDMLNAHLRFMDYFSFEHVEIINDIRRKHPREYDRMLKESEMRFRIGDAEIQKLVNKTRDNSAQLLREYAIKKHIHFWIVSGVINLGEHFHLKPVGATFFNKCYKILNETTQSIEFVSFQNAVKTNYQFAV